MADYFTNFSLILDLPDESAQTYALDLAEVAASQRFSDDLSTLPPDFPESLREILEYWCFETKAESPSQPGQYGLWLHSMDGGIDAVCAFIQHLLKKFKPTEAVSFEWSHDCSKPRTDAYGGGAAIITAAKIKTMTTGEWLHKQAIARERQLQRKGAKP